MDRTSIGGGVRKGGNDKRILVIPTKATVFQAVNRSNGNVAAVASVVAPKFKISRGTQLGVEKYLMATSTPPTTARQQQQPPTSPPLPAKPPCLVSSKHLNKSPNPPPIPPKPDFTTSNTKTRVPSPIKAKPALPPKPLNLSNGSTSTTGVPNRPQRTSRSDSFYKGEPRSPPPTVTKHLLTLSPVAPSRKSASLGRLEGMRILSLLDRTPRDSGFVSNSLEYVDQSGYASSSSCSGGYQPLVFPSTSGSSLPPTAPPRARRRKSVDTYEPIYAVVDFSKKTNRRHLLTASPPDSPKSPEALPPSSTDCDHQEHENYQPILDTNDEADVFAPNENQNEPVSGQQQTDSDLELSIENSFATIIESFSHCSDDDLSFATPLANEGRRREISSSEEEEEEEDKRHSGIITRLVFGGNVIDQNDLMEKVVTTPDAFGSALKDAHFQFQQQQPLILDRLGVSRHVNRESSPAPSATSCSSTDTSSKEDDPSTGKHFDPDVASAGSLGDVDTSDVTRQNSVEEETSIGSSSGEAAAAETRDNKSQMSGFRRTFGNLFGSLGKSSAVKSKVAEGTESSSTDAEQQKPAVKAHLCVSRTAPPIPAQQHQQRFNRVARVYRSVQPKSVAALVCDGGGDVTIIGSPTADSNSTPFDQLSDSTSVSSMAPVGGDSVAESSSIVTEGPISRTDSASESGEEDDCYSLQGKEKKAYLTAKEIASSERVFVDCLRLICVDFRAAVTQASTANGSPIIPEADLNKILSYLPHLQNLNQELLGDFELRLSQWSTLPKICDVIVRKGPFLKLYSAYIRDFQSQSALLDECVQKYPRFGKTLKEFELSDRCKCLSLKHYMLKPVQRLPQYRLLLDVYLHNLNESSIDYSDTVAALKVVTEVAEHANNSMKQEDTFQKLLRLQSRLGNCEIIKPGRYIIKEGELDKVSRKTLQPRYFILLNDCLLYTSYLSSPSPTSSLKLHHELPLSRMEIQLPAAATVQDCGHEFNVISTTRSFTLSAISAEIRDDWMHVLGDTINQFQAKLSSFLHTGTGGVESMETRLGQQAPVWIPDKRVTMCQLCTAAFTVTFRRHHCRACGKVICRTCSARKAELEYLKFRPARVCDDCFSAIKGPGAHDDLDTSNCSSTIEPDVSATLVKVPPVCLVHAFNDHHLDDNRRPSSDPVGPVSSQAALRAQQVRRDHARKERRYIPQRLLEVSASDSGSQMSGYLSRRVRRTWKKNWFVLKDRVLYIYRASEDVVALDTIPVLGYFVESVHEESQEESENVFQLCHPKQPPIVFQADNAPLTKKWMEALSSSTVL